MKSPSGLDVFVGKNARENEYLSTVVLSGNDYWFHAKGTPGPHVILKVPKGVVPTKLDLKFVKYLASKGGPVTVARGTNIIKIKGDPVGTVRVKD
jgi:hypothetical protein